MIFGSDLDLNDKWGPLPIWAYVAGAGGLIAFFMWRRANQPLESSDASGYVDVGQVEYPTAPDPGGTSGVDPSGGSERDDQPYVIPGIGVVTGPGQVFNPFPKSPEAPPAPKPEPQPPKADPIIPPKEQPKLPLSEIVERRFYQAIGDDSDIYYIEHGQKRLITGRPFNLPFTTVSRESLGPLANGPTIRVQDIPN